MPRKPAPDARERILATAARLFRESSVRAVGLQQVIDECGCGKSLLYREFTCKDDLVAAYLQRCHDEWTESIERATRPMAGDPVGQLLAIVRSVGSEIAENGFRGCPLHGIPAEFPDPEHPAHQVATASHADVRARLQTLAERAGAGDPGALAERIHLIIDGLYTHGGIVSENRAAAAASALAFAEDVIRAAVRT